MFLQTTFSSAKMATLLILSLKKENRSIKISCQYIQAMWYIYFKTIRTGVNNNNLSAQSPTSGSILSLDNSCETLFLHLFKERLCVLSMGVHIV